MTQPGPTIRLMRRLSALPPDAARQLEAALERAELAGARFQEAQRVPVVFVYGPRGISGIEVVRVIDKDRKETTLIEWRPEGHLTLDEST